MMNGKGGLGEANAKIIISLDFPYQTQIQASC